LPELRLLKKNRGLSPFTPKKTVVCPRLHRLHWVQFVGGFLKPLD